MMVETAASLLRRAKQQIVQHGWSPFDMGERLCIFSAIGLVTFGRRVIDLSEAEMTAVERTAEHIRSAVGSPKQLYDWESSKQRITADILSAFDRAISAAELELHE